MGYSYYQPEYFQKFRCMGGTCPESCCRSWSIRWNIKEIEKLKSAPLSDRLKKLVEEKFVEANKENRADMFKILLDEDGSCPFQDRENGLCCIQAEVGEEYLGNTCGTYPRRFLVIDDYVFRSCSTSCPAVIKLLMHDKKAAQMETVPVRDINETILKDSPRSLKERPYLQYRKLIIDFYSWIFSGKTRYEQAMFLGPIPAKRISDAAEDAHKIEIPSILRQAKDVFAGMDLIELENSVKSDYRSKSNIASTLLMNLPDISVILELFKKDDKFDEEKYLIGKKKFYENITNADTALKNIALNIFLDLFIGLDLKSKTFFDFYVYFTACMSTVGYIAAAVGYIGENIEADFIKYVAIFSRRISHSKESEKIIFDYVKENGINTPESVASFIK